MPKPHTFPTLFDDVLTLSITKLKKWGYLEPGHIMPGKVYWSIDGVETASISIRVDTMAARPFIELDYKFRDEPRNYRIYFASVPSNLGKGKVLYFLCPQTNKLCRKVYSVGGYFLHREAFTGCMYEIQTQSKKNRYIISMVEPFVKQSEYRSEINKKHFKKYYAGKPTKRYLKILAEIEKGDRITLEQYTNFLMV